MSGIEITCGRISPCGPLNGQPRAHTYSISKVYKKSKRKPTKRKTKEKPDDGTDAPKATSSAKKRKLCEIKGDDLGGSAYYGTGDCVVDTPASVFSKSTGVQDSSIDHLQPIMEKRVPTPGERWELDSGFASEASPPSSGRCSPCIGSCPAKIVAIDCEMVGTGPDGHCSELARCSVLNYDGNVLYDQYILPRRPVTNYRTRWSGIRKQHLKHAIPFEKARTEIVTLIKDKVVIGHALHNDFKALGFSHPWHMTRDTMSSRALRQMCSLPSKNGASLKTLTRRLLNRNIQVGQAGHCSVEDALAALDLYKLVEDQWEQNNSEKERAPPQLGPDPSLSHYMLDQYWPEHMDCSQ
ncbi:apoptosis-enhancing nuclease [Sardina pilchardus]|uniref:apoptosis-enhancing nuclease n=1 Tax=Sardina pilchardus TaxID=27697 RepID=UPI002E152837